MGADRLGAASFCAGRTIARSARMKIPSVVIATLAAAVGGCAGYRPSAGECVPGYSEASLDDRSYRIRIDAPGLSNESSLADKFNRRAGELCPSGFTVGAFAFDTGACMHRSPAAFSLLT